MYRPELYRLWEFFSSLYIAFSFFFSFLFCCLEGFKVKNRANGECPQPPPPGYSPFFPQIVRFYILQPKYVLNWV